MSHFYGTLKGTKGEATRCGDAKNGMRSETAGWAGAVRVELSVRDGVDWAEVYLIPWQGSGTHLRLYEGPVSGPKSSDIDEALRCKTCVAQRLCQNCIKYSNWKSIVDGPSADCRPSAPVKKEKKHGTQAV